MASRIRPRSALLVGLVATLALSGCGGSDTMASPDAPTMLVVLRAPQSQLDQVIPTAELRWNGSDLAMSPTHEGLTWPVPDDFGLHLILPELSSPVPARTAVALEGDSSRADVFVAPLFSNEDLTRIEPVDGVWRLPTKPGRYLLRVVSHWPEGDLGFSVGVEVG